MTPFTVLWIVSMIQQSVIARSTYHSLSSSRQLLSAPFNLSQWTTSINTMPRSDRNMVAAHLNNTITLFGGTENKRQWTQYNIDDDSFTDKGENILSMNVSSTNGNTYFTQIDESLYWIDYHYPSKIIIYHLRSQSFSDNISIPQSVQTTACMTSSASLLFVTGGGWNNVLDTIFIFNISINSWIPYFQMQTARGQHCCEYNAIQNEIWMIGGWNGSVLHSVEKISVYNFSKRQYTDNLNIGVKYSTSSLYNNYIFMMGGWDGQKGRNEIQRIDCISGNVVIADRYLNYDVYRAAGITFNHRIYIFGGYGGSNTMQYLYLPTMNPTESPTVKPTSPPSLSGNVCSNKDDDYINTTYQIAANSQSCIDGIIQIISKLIEIIDTIYRKNDLFVCSNITKQQRETLGDIGNAPFCGNLSIHILTEFDAETNQEVLINITKSELFEEEINKEMNNTIFVNITTVIYIYIENDNDNINYMIIWILSGLSLFICILSVLSFCVIIKRRKMKLDSLTIKVSKPLIIAVAIEFYEDDPKEPDDELKEAECRDLDGVRYDIRNICKLFKDRLNYAIEPKYDLELKNGAGIKADWTEKELMELIESKAKHLNNNIDEYDSLVFIISCHGMDDYIISSDYKRLKKSAIHRAFSARYPNIRLYPRLFLYDCCCGGNERDHRTRQRIQESMDDIKIKEENVKVNKIEKDDNNDSGKAIKVKRINKTNDGSLEHEVGKEIALTTIHNENSSIWAADELSPDYRLIEGHGSMEGFQSKMRSDKGSYFISSFIDNMMDNIDNNDNKLFLEEIFDNIQTQLLDKGKQHIEFKCNDGTRYLKFIKNTDTAQSINLYQK